MLVLKNKYWPIYCYQFLSLKYSNYWETFFVTESKSMSHTGCVLLFSFLMCISIVQWVWHTVAHISEWDRNSVQLLMSVMGINNRRQACGS